MTAAGQLGLDLAAPAPATTARPCRCDPPAVFASEDGPTCAKCGRAP